MTAWADLDPEIRAVAEEVCTAKELAALRYHLRGWGYRSMAPYLGCSRDAARDRVDRALKKLARRKIELEERAA